MTPPALGQVPVGAVLDWPGPTSPPGDWLESYGQSLLRASYLRLFAALNSIANTGTITAASPAVVTVGSPHGFVIGQPIFFRVVSGVTGLSANVTYYVATTPTSTTYTVAATRSINVITGAVTPGASINTGGVAGVAEAWYSPYEIADATHFYLPDYRGRVGVALDNMGGSDAGFSVWPNILGLRAGEGTHTNLSTESGVPAHTHPSLLRVVVAPIGGGNLGTAGSYNETTVPITANTPADAAAAHNTVPPSIAVRKIIYAGVTA